MTESIHEFRCPACQAGLSAFPDQLGQIFQCGFCQERFALTEALTLPIASPPTAPPVAVRRFNFQCLRCGSILEGKSDLSGKQGQCPTCAALFTIPHVHPATGLPISLATTGEDGENPTPMHAYAAAGDKAPQIVRGQDGQAHILCPRCQAQSDIEANNCMACGLPFTIEGASFQSSSASNTYAVISMVLGIIAIPTAFCQVGGPMGVVAMVFGLLARRQVSISQSGQDRGRFMAMTGIGLGIAAILIALVRIPGVI